MKTNEQIVDALNGFLSQDKFKHLYPHQNKDLAFFDGIHADLKNQGYTSILFVDPNTKGAYYLVISKDNNSCSTRAPFAGDYESYDDWKQVYDKRHKDLITNLRDVFQSFLLS